MCVNEVEMKYLTHSIYSGTLRFHMVRYFPFPLEKEQNTKTLLTDLQTDIFELSGV